MVDKYEEIFDRYKKFIKENSHFEPNVVKYNTNTSPYFPLIVLTLSNNVDTNYCTNDKIEYYEEFYLSVNFYAKNKRDENNNLIASQVVINELVKLTNQFFKELNMKKTLSRPVMNFDKEILRHTSQYQCLIGNVRGNIIRR